VRQIVSPRIASDPEGPLRIAAGQATIFALRQLAPPAGFEPAHTAPETNSGQAAVHALSSENVLWRAFVADVLSWFCR
jgi:hypothetical protein